MIKRLASGHVPAIAFLLCAAGLAAPASAEVASAIGEATVPSAASASTATGSSTPATATITSPVSTADIPTPAPIAAPTEPVATPVPVLQVTPAPAATVLAPVAPGRAAVLSTQPRPVSGLTPPSGTVPIRPAVTHAGLWPMVWAKMHAATASLSEQEECIAVAVYHEARGEPLSGQLAVAEVIMNRAASGRYPAGWCDVVKQPWQFSFVHPRSGRIPAVNRASASWAYAQAITRIAVGQYADALPADVLWYHADYVAPSWGRRLAKVEKIGAHIFYRAS